MSLTDKIDNDLKQALKEKNQLKLGTLRMLKSAVHNQEIADKKKALADQVVLTVIRRELKKHQDSIIAFKAGGREELAAQEQAEADILSQYVPAMMAQEEVAKIVDEVIKTGLNNFGQVMKEVMTKTKGQADGQLVQQLVKEKLG